MDAADMGDDLERVLLTEEQLGSRLDEIAAQIDADYAGKDVLLVGVLKGAVMVMADLARRLHGAVQMDWMAVSSYGSGTKSSGVVRILKDLDADLTGRHVLIVEDIIDSGLTLSWLVANLRSRGPESVEIATMLRKPEAAKVDVDVRYVGFEIPNEFVVGYGLDYAERYRNLPFVGTLAPHVYGATERRRPAGASWAMPPWANRATGSTGRTCNFQGNPLPTWREQGHAPYAHEHQEPHPRSRPVDRPRRGHPVDRRVRACCSPQVTADRHLDRPRAARARARSSRP